MSKRQKLSSENIVKCTYSICALAGFVTGIIFAMLSGKDIFSSFTLDYKSAFSQTSPFNELVKAWGQELIYFVPIFLFAPGLFAIPTCSLCIFLKFASLSFSSVCTILCNCGRSVYFTHAISCFISSLFLFAVAISFSQTKIKSTSMFSLLSFHIKKSLFFCAILFFIAVFRNILLLILK